MTKRISLGSSKDKPKKVIEVNVSPRHYVGATIFLFVMVFAIILAVNSIFPSEKLEFSCNDGTKEEIVEGKTVYCGQNYEEVMQYFDIEDKNKIKQIIFGEKK